MLWCLSEDERQCKKYFSFLPDMRPLLARTEISLLMSVPSAVPDTCLCFVCAIEMGGGRGGSGGREGARICRRVHSDTKADASLHACAQHKKTHACAPVENKNSLPWFFLQYYYFRALLRM